MMAKVPGKRRGAVLAMVAAAALCVVGMVSVAFDWGYRALVRAQAQAAADAAALAGAQELLSDRRLQGYWNEVQSSSRSRAAQYAGYHRLGSRTAQLVVGEDVQIGRLENAANLSEPLDMSNSAQCNAVQVTVRATAERGTPTAHFFAQAFGQPLFDTQATATAAFLDQISGFRIVYQGDTVSVMPFAIKRDAWVDMLQNGGRDDFAYDPATGHVRGGADGIDEIKLYPGRKTPGNWGTVDIGGENNSTSDLSRQILYGANQADLAHFGGALQLDPVTHTLLLNGDDGISSGIKDELEAIVGHPRTICLYSAVDGTGNNTYYTIVGFAGVRIVEVDFGGKDKVVTVQPAYVTDDSGIWESDFQESWFVVQPLQLVR